MDLRELWVCERRWEEGVSRLVASNELSVEEIDFVYRVLNEPGEHDCRTDIGWALAMHSTLEHGECVHFAIDNDGPYQTDEDDAEGVIHSHYTQRDVEEVVSTVYLNRL